MSEYLDRVAELLEQVRPGLASTHALGFKNVFGAVAGYVNGAIFISSGRFGIALRLPPDTLGELLKEEGVEPLRYFEKGHVKKEYAVLPVWLLEDRPRLRKLVDTSIDYVGRPSALPKPPRTPREPRRSP